MVGYRGGLVESSETTPSNMVEIAKKIAGQTGFEVLLRRSMSRFPGFARSAPTPATTGRCPIIRGHSSIGNDHCHDLGSQLVRTDRSGSLARIDNSLLRSFRC